MRSADIPLSLYVHWPWCVRKCPYCDFNSHALTSSYDPSRQYIDALIHDLKHSIAYAQNRELISIFIGGGTPSLIAPQELERFLETVFLFLKSLQTLKLPWKPIPEQSIQRTLKPTDQSASIVFQWGFKASMMSF